MCGQDARPATKVIRFHTRPAEGQFLYHSSTKREKNILKQSLYGPKRVAASSHGASSIDNKPEQRHSSGESVRAQEVKRYAPCLLEHQKYPRCKEQLCGRRLPLGSHAPALCLFQLCSGSMGEAHSWVVCPTWSHTVRFCALHLIVVALSWGAQCSHSQCRYAAIISSSAKRGA